jgi:nucleoside 2-deoxyribosyltransferase
MCSRIAKDAHSINNRVASYLRGKGYKVFVPHEAHYNESSINGGKRAPDSEIYEQDMAEMLAADACVVVGRIGTDCGFEVGWFQNHGVDTVWYTGTVDIGWHPMLHLVPKVKHLKKIDRFIQEALVKMCAAKEEAV